jgi:hypothetical protein
LPHPMKVGAEPRLKVADLYGSHAASLAGLTKLVRTLTGPQAAATSLFMLWPALAFCYTGQHPALSRRLGGQSPITSDRCRNRCAARPLATSGQRSKTRGLGPRVANHSRVAANWGASAASKAKRSTVGLRWHPRATMGGYDVAHRSAPPAHGSHGAHMKSDVCATLVIGSGSGLT